MNRSLFTPVFAALVLAACAEDVPPEATDLESPVAVPEPAFDPCGALDPGPQRLVVPGFEDRQTWVHLPEGDGPRDAVVMLHAAGGSPQSVADVTRFHRRAEERGMIAVYPSSFEVGSWRAGPSENVQEMEPVDDVGYLSAVSDALAEQLCVDRVLAAGVDRGGMMAQRWACEGTGVDAVVSVAGPRLHHTCDQPPVPALLVHGLEDQRMPYDGSPSPLTGRQWPSADDTTEAWLVHNGWNREEPATRDFGPYACDLYPGDALVTHCSVDGWGHAWPGGRNTPDQPGVDMTRQSLIWFARAMR